MVLICYSTGSREILDIFHSFSVERRNSTRLRLVRFNRRNIPTTREIYPEYHSCPCYNIYLLHGSAWNMTRYFTSCDSIVTSRRRVEIQSTSEMSPYFTMTKCNKLFITYLTSSTERLPSLPSSFSTISTISTTVVVTTLFKKR